MKQLIQAAIRVITVLFLIELVQNTYYTIPGLVTFLSSGFGFISEVYFLLILLVVDIIITGVIIYFGWWKSEKIARVLVGELDDEPLVISTSNGELVSLILSVLGIYLFVTSIADLGGLAAYELRASAIDPVRIDFTPNSTGQLISNGITLIFSILLMGKGTKIGLLFVNFWKHGSLNESPVMGNDENKKERANTN